MTWGGEQRGRNDLSGKCHQTREFLHEGMQSVVKAILSQYRDGQGQAQSTSSRGIGTRQKRNRDGTKFYQSHHGAHAAAHTTRCGLVAWYVCTSLGALQAAAYLACSRVLDLSGVACHRLWRGCGRRQNAIKVFAHCFARWFAQRWGPSWHFQ